VIHRTSRSRRNLSSSYEHLMRASDVTGISRGISCYRKMVISCASVHALFSYRQLAVSPELFPNRLIRASGSCREAASTIVEANCRDRRKFRSPRSEYRARFLVGRFLSNGRPDVRGDVMTSGRIRRKFVSSERKFQGGRQIVEKRSSER